MNTDNGHAKTFTAHLDILMDVLRIVFDNGLPFSIEGINEREDALIVKMSINPKRNSHRKAMENIKSLVDDYGHYRYGNATEIDSFPH